MCSRTEIRSLNDVKKHPTVNISKPGLLWSQLAQSIRITDSDWIKSVSNSDPAISQLILSGPVLDPFIVAYFVPSSTMHVKSLIQDIQSSLKALAFLITCLSLMIKVYIHNRFEKQRVFCKSH